MRAFTDGFRQPKRGRWALEWVNLRPLVPEAPRFNVPWKWLGIAAAFGILGFLFPWEWAAVYGLPLFGMAQQALPYGQSDNDPVVANRIPNREAWKRTGEMFSDLYSSLSTITDAGAFEFSGELTDEEKIDAALASALASGDTIVRVPFSFIPYDITALTNLTAFTAAGGRLVREGGDLSVYDVQAYGAAGDGIQDDTASVRAALTVVMAAVAPVLGGVVYLPEGRYRITSKLLIDAGQRIQLLGAGRAAAILQNEVVGSPADPMLEVTSPNNYFLIQGLGIQGNNVSGAGGNGHGIALINREAGAGSTTFWPQQVMIRDCTIESLQGTGKSSTGASIPACAIYSFGGTGQYFSNTFSYGNKTGWRLDLMSKVYLNQCSVDVASECAVRIENGCESIGMVGCILNGSGSGGVQQGLIYVQSSSDISFTAGRLKNGNPYLVNVAHDSGYAYAVTVRDSSCQQMDSASGHIGFAIGNGASGCTIDANTIEFTNISDAVGIQVSQAQAGKSLTGLRVTGNVFRIANAGTLAAGVKLNVTSNRVFGALIASNTFGSYASGGMTITNGIELLGFEESTTIRNNTFVAVTGDVITACIKLASLSLVGTRIADNVYHAFGGTITKDVSDGGSVIAYTREESGYWQGGEIADPVAPIINAGRLYFKDNGAGKTQLVVRFATGAVQVIATEP